MRSFLFSAAFLVAAVGLPIKVCSAVVRHSRQALTVAAGASRVYWCLAILVAFLPLATQGAWIDPTGKPLPDTESMRSAGDLGVRIVLAADEGQFRRTWNASTTPPKLSTTTTVRLGESVSALLIFHGCSPNAGGVCNLACEFTLEGPDGSKTPAGGGPVWSGKPTQAGLLQLGQASMTIGIEKSDPVGDYKITASVKDKVSGRTLSVVARLKVTK